MKYDILDKTNSAEMEEALRHTSSMHTAILDQTLYTNIGKNNDEKLYNFLCAMREIPQMVEYWGIVVGEAG
jgi:hypothetical protein